ncbi:Protein of unknown function [Pyronema omphalodes CBS 100304]|uniref:Uncharacterized protein n=1 Tax=Pyronema omphalodes (strain CBS 100304) TaxID=1076935 RepID=U4LFQ3_PYROM|nr:Protein of unknown function [Pyronema omphalodes CBS 100304]
MFLGFYFPAVVVKLTKCVTHTDCDIHIHLLQSIAARVKNGATALTIPRCTDLTEYCVRVSMISFLPFWVIPSKNVSISSIVSPDSIHVV